MDARKSVRGRHSILSAAGLDGAAERGIGRSERTGDGRSFGGGVKGIGPGPNSARPSDPTAIVPSAYLTRPPASPRIRPVPRTNEYSALPYGPQVFC